MRIALTGASGFLGSHIARHLAGAGHRVTALVRPTSRRDHLAAHVDRFVEGDHADESIWLAFLEAADCVLHASIARQAWNQDQPAPLSLHLHSNLVASIRLLRASRPLPFIFVSSMAIHRDLAPHPPETDPDNHDLPGPYYAAYKASVEAHLKAEHGRPCITVRPAMVYGIDPVLKRSRGYDIVQRLIRGEPFRQPGWGIFTHVDDVAAAITAIAGDPGLAAREYDLADCYARHSDWAQLAAEVLGIKARIEITDSAAAPGQFKPGAAGAPGVPLGRGLDGIRHYLSRLAASCRDDLR